MMPREIVDACDLGKLPSGPRVLSQLLSAVQKPDVELSELATLFHADPALTARAVAACNSPFYSRGSHITDIREAIMHIGMKEVSRIVQMVVLTDFKKYPTHLYTSVSDHFWERSLHTALVVDEISGKRPEAYTAGIMHLVGVWVLCSIFPVGYLSISERELDLQAQLEQHRLGVNFARAGGKAMKVWGFSPEICAAVMWQLAPSAVEQPEHRELATLINRAVAITDWHYGVRNEHTLIRSDLTINDLEDCNQRTVELVSKIGLGA
jgi:HD-like signal output (HDOD) protein